jgi:hypothetical protein
MSSRAQRGTFRGARLRVPRSARDDTGSEAIDLRPRRRAAAARDPRCTP